MRPHHDRGIAAAFTISLALLSVLFVAASANAKTNILDSNRTAWTADDLFASPSPYALGHRGYGANTGEDPNRPIENTLTAFHTAFHDGIRCIELDLQTTADGKVIVIHDDFLEDFTCVSSLTYDELLVRRPLTPTFHAVLNSSRHFGYSTGLSGIVFAEIKVPVPLCDGANTSEQAATSEGALVAAVVEEIRSAGMEDQVILNSGSPLILHQVAMQAPEIKRALTLNALQLLTPDQVSGILHMPVVKIEKNDCGLEWYNIGVIARLPSMPGANGQQRFGSFLGTALGCAGATAVSLDKLALGSNPAQAQGLIGAVHHVGLEAIVWTIDTEAEWNFMAAAGADGITTNNVAVGLANQASLSALIAADLGNASALSGTESASRDLAAEPALAIRPPRLGASRDGSLRVEFVLPNGGPARLVVMDIAGRQIDSREVGSLGPGQHELSLGRNLPSGIYLVRLANGHDQVLAKATVLR